MRSPERADAAVVCRDVTKQFYVYSHRTTSVREWFVRTVRRRPLHVRQADFSLQQFDLRVERGEAVALIGRNGCGKSTVLRLIAGIYTPSRGTITVDGRVGAVIELGAGFNLELTGAENLDLYGAILGLTGAELAGRRDAIIEFAGVREFIDMPVKYYSSGMRARLAFSVAINLRPDVLLLDEVLAVGDQAFQERCLERLRAFHAAGGTLVVVTHDLQLAGDLCARAVWLEHGRVRLQGEAGQVLAAYRASSAQG